VTLSPRTFYLKRQISLESRLLTMAPVVLKMSVFIPIFNQGSIELLRSFWAFLIPLLLICGHLVASWLNFTRAFLCSREKMKLSNWHILWKFKESPMTILLMFLKGGIYFSKKGLQYPYLLRILEVEHVGLTQRSCHHC
jgi:predicted ABC-type exoprotein transport system permease subunit